MTIRMVLALAAALLLPVAASAAEAPDEHEHDDHHVSELNGVRTVHAWTRATGGPVALVFVEIENRSDADVMLMGGECECADSVELVGFQLKNGEEAYATLPGLPIKADGEMVLAPNGVALRLDGLHGALHQGEEFEMEIAFDIGALDVHVAVEASDARQHSHAGHNH